MSCDKEHQMNLLTESKACPARMADIKPDLHWLCLVLHVGPRALRCAPEAGEQRGRQLRVAAG